MASLPLKSLFQNENEIISQIRNLIGIQDVTVYGNTFASLKCSSRVKVVDNENDVNPHFICLLSKGSWKSSPPNTVTLDDSKINDCEMEYFIFKAEREGGEIQYAVLQRTVKGWEAGLVTYKDSKDIMMDLCLNYRNLDIVGEPRLRYKIYIHRRLNPTQALGTFSNNTSCSKFLSMRVQSSSVAQNPTSLLPPQVKALRQPSIKAFLQPQRRNELPLKETASAEKKFILSPTVSIKSLNSSTAATLSRETRVPPQISPCTSNPSTSSSSSKSLFSKSSSAPTTPKLRDRVDSYFKVYFEECSVEDKVQEILKLKAWLIQRGGLVRNHAYHFLMCYNSATECIFFTSLPHSGNHEGLTICRFDDEKTPICLKTVDQKFMLCSSHLQMKNNVKLVDIKYTDLVRKWVQTKFTTDRKCTAEAIEDAIVFLQSECENVHVIESAAIVTTKEDSIFFYGLVTNYPLHRLCGYDGCLAVTPSASTKLCKTHDPELCYFAVKVCDYNNKRAVFFAVVCTSGVKAKENSELLKEIGRKLEKYKKERVSENSRASPYIYKRQSYDNEDAALETMRNWLFVAVLKNMVLKEKFIIINDEVPIPPNPDSLKEELVTNFLRATRRGKVRNKIKRCSLKYTNTERNTLQVSGHRHNYCVTTEDNKRYIGETSNSRGIVDQWHTRPNSTSQLHKYYQQKQVKSEEVLCIADNVITSKSVEALLIIAQVLLAAFNIGEVGVVYGILNKEFVISDLQLSEVDLEDVSLMMQLLSKNEDCVIEYSGY